MATFRRDLSKIINEESFEEEQNFVNEDVSSPSVPVKGPGLEYRESEESDEEDSTNGLNLLNDDDESVSLKPAIRKGQKVGRKGNWQDYCIDEVVDVICENEYYRNKLIFTNNKASKNLEIYMKIVKEVKTRLTE